MISTRVLQYGSDESLPQQIALAAGPLTLIWDDGDLRYIKLGNYEVLRRIYVAIRDRNWGTVTPVMSNLAMDVGTDAFRISFDVENRQREIDFVWHGEIFGTADGTIRFSMDGHARSTFLRNRIGFCLLHPAEAGGAAARVTHVDGSLEGGILPVDVVSSQPVLPFAEMTGIGHEVLPGVWAELQFVGDIFEMEDQRNWTDASYKTFCTPLRLPFPVEIQAGTKVQQAITLTLRDERPRRPDAQARPAAELTFTVDPAALGATLPLLGLGMASHGGTLSDRERSRLQALHLDHLRADLRLAQPGHAADLRRATVVAAALNVPLHLALFVTPETADQELAALRLLLDTVRTQVSTFLIYPAREIFRGGTPVASVVAAARRHLKEWSHTRCAAGTNADYIFMARSVPPLDQIDALTFAIHPQEHAFDNASLVETLAAQAVVVASARRLGSGLPVMVSPVTLKRRFNPHAAAPEPLTPPGLLPPPVDPRQMSLFAAGWTAGSLKYLAAAGAASVTYYETTGWRGVMETEAGSPAAPFQALAGAVFPLYHVLADAGEFAGGEVLVGRSSDPLVVDGLALRVDGRLRVLIANLSAEQRLVSVRGLPSTIWLRMLDGSNAEDAMWTADAYRAHPGVVQEIRADSLSLVLAPYALARLDSEFAREPLVGVSALKETCL